LLGINLIHFCAAA
jgi:hypothetical protein